MFSKFNTDKMETLFLFSMTDNNKCMRDIKKKCMDNGITEKYIYVKDAARACIEILTKKYDLHYRLNKEPCQNLPLQSL